MATEQSSSPPPAAPSPIFSGALIGILVRLGALALIDAFAIWFVSALVGQEEIILAGFITVITLGVNAVFLIDGLYPYRWFSPGLALLILVLIYPTVFTVYVAFTNYRTGNLLTRTQTEEVFDDRLYLPEEAPVYEWYAFRSTDDADTYGLWLIPVVEGAGETMFAEEGAVTLETEIDLTGYEVDEDGVPSGLPGWERLERREVFRIADSTLSTIEFGEAGNVIKFNPKNTQQAGEFQQRYTFNNDGSMFDEEWGVWYEPDDGTFMPVAGPYMDEEGNVAIAQTDRAGNTLYVAPLTRYTLDPAGTLLDTETEVLYDLNSGGEAVQGPFISRAGQIAIDGTLAEPLDQYALNDDGTLRDTDTDVVYTVEDGQYVPGAGPLTSKDDRVAINGDAAVPLEAYTFADARLTEVESGIVYEWNGDAFAPVEGPFTDADGNVLEEEDGDPVAALAQFTLNDDGTLFDVDADVLYELQDGVFTPIDAPFTDAEGALYYGATTVLPLTPYELQDDATLLNTATDVVYEAQDGVYTPISAPYQDQEGQLAFSAEIVPPMVRYELQDDGTLYDTQKRFTFELDMEGVLQPIDGPFRDADGQVLDTVALDEVRPGYYVVIGMENFKQLVTDERIRGPFVRVFTWTFAHAFFSVFLTFWLGLFLALLLNVKFTPGRAVLRTALLVPYAIPAFISVLIWRGLLNDNLGVINKVLVDILPISEGPRWRTDPMWVKLAILTIQLWLGFPYMMLITTGALQSIPGDIYEASRVDGASAYQQFRFLTLPMLLVAVGPLLIASFAFNFNNFTIVELFAEGGPPQSPDTPAGHSDILITYTYALAFGSGRGADYGFASTISIVIFVIVAVITFFNFRFTQSWEEISENV